MKLWVLKRENGRIGYDENEGFVIAADSEELARSLASEQSGDEPKETWLGEGATCVELRAKDYKEPSVILCAFNAG